jgi:hypothetical protein
MSFSLCCFRFSCFTLDVGTDFLYGHSVGSLTDRPSIPSRLAYRAFSEAFDLVRNIVTKRVKMCVVTAGLPDVHLSTNSFLKVDPIGGSSN